MELTNIEKSFYSVTDPASSIGMYNDDIIWSHVGKEFMANINPMATLAVSVVHENQVHQCAQ